MQDIDTFSDALRKAMRDVQDQFGEDIFVRFVADYRETDKVSGDGAVTDSH